MLNMIMLGIALLLLVLYIARRRARMTSDDA